MDNLTITLSPRMCDLLARGINALADNGDLGPSSVTADEFDSLTVVLSIFDDAAAPYRQGGSI